MFPTKIEEWGISEVKRKRGTKTEKRTRWQCGKVKKHNGMDFEMNTGSSQFPNGQLWKQPFMGGNGFEPPV